jgi:AraC family transcriptional regulator
MSDFESATTPAQGPIVNLTPPSIISSQAGVWHGIEAHNVQVLRHEPFDYEFKASRHLLTATERAARYDGETLVDGLPVSQLRDFSLKMTFVPAGYRFYGWQRPRALTRTTFVYIDPQGPLLDAETGSAAPQFTPRLFFFDREIWETVRKLKVLVENPHLARRAHAEALGVVLAHELMRLNSGMRPTEELIRGGLAGWRQKTVAQYIDEHLADDLSLLELAKLVGLSPFHFSRAFKQTFGTPPHRYLATRRVERAKALLAQPQLSVTEIALGLGFAESSSFTAAFRRVTGQTPSSFRRGLD